MRKLLGILLVLLLLIAASYFIYTLNVKQIKNQHSEGINAIPQNAAVIIRASDPYEKMAHFKNSAYGKNWLEMAEVQELDSILNLHLTDLNNIAIYKQLIQRELYCSLHMTGVQSYHYLDVADLSAEEADEFEKETAKRFKNQIITTRTYEEIRLSNIKADKNDEGFNYFFHEGLLAISNSPILLEDAVLQLKHRQPLSERNDFEKLFKSADPSMDANIFINYQEFGQLAQVFLNERYSVSKRLNHFGSWMALDLKMSDNGILLNGLSQINDSIPSFLGTLKNCAPGPMDVASVIPDNVASVKYLSIDHFESWMKELKLVLQEKQELYQFEKNISGLDKSLGINVTEDFYRWIGKEFCVFITQNDFENPTKYACFALHSNNIELTEEKLQQITQNSSKSDTTVFMNYTIRNVGLVNFLPVTLGDFFTASKQTFYTIIQDYVIFANDVGNLKNVINSYLLGKTLIKNLEFKNYYENFASSSNYFNYINPKKAGNFWKYYLNPELGELLTKNQEVLNNIQGFGFQTIANSELQYSNLYSNFKVIEQDESVSLVECVLDTSYSRAPWIVRNHYTNEKEILLQDDKNTLYLINNVGVILWKQKLSRAIVGDVHMVDRYKNKKIQYLFGIGDQLVLLDRKGRFVEGFPTKLKSEQTGGIAVMDYDKNRNYRILIPAGKEILNYSIEGKKVQGWEFKGAKAKIITVPELLQYKGKDYIYFCDADGNMYATGRRGEPRIGFDNQLPKKRANYQIIRQSTPKNSGIATTDTSGIVYFLNLSDELDPIPTRNYTAKHHFQVNQLNEDGVSDFLFVDENEIYGYKMTKNQIFKIEGLDFNITGKPKVYDLSNKADKIITFTQKDQENVYAFSNDGQAIENFPLNGVSEPLIEDLNEDGKMELLIGNKTGSLFIYSLFN